MAAVYTRREGITAELTFAHQQLGLGATLGPCPNETKKDMKF